MARSSLLTASWKRNLLRWAGQMDGALGTVSGHDHDGTNSKSITASVTYGLVGAMAAAGTAAANTVGVAASSSRTDHVHALGTHTHAGATTGGTIGPSAFAADVFTADAAGRAPFANGWLTGAKIANLTITNGLLAAGILSADATGRALMATDFFDATTAAAKFADSSIPTSKVNWSFSVTTPVTVTPDSAGAVGVASTPARSDHEHPCTAAAPTGYTLAAADAEGAAATFARSNHVHKAILANAVWFVCRNATDAADVNMIQISATNFVKLGTASVEISTANLVTLTFTNPAAPRTITFGDPGGADSVVYVAAAQTLTGKSLTTPGITGGTAIELTGFSLRSTGAAFDLVIATTAVYTADRTLTVNIPTGANAALTLTGDLIRVGAHSLTLTTSGATDVTLPTTGTLATLDGVEALTGKTITLAANANLTVAGSADLVLAANTAAALEVSDATTKLTTWDSRNTVSAVSMLTVINPASQTLPDNATSWHRLVTLTGYTATLAGVTQVTTAMDGMMLYLGAPTINQSGGAVTVDKASAVYITAVAQGANVTITDKRIIDTSIGAYLTNAGVWTDVSLRSLKHNIKDLDTKRIKALLAQVKVRSYERDDPSDGGFERFGLIAEEAPDFLAMPSRDGVAPGYVAGFALAVAKALAERVEALEARI